MDFFEIKPGHFINLRQATRIIIKIRKLYEYALKAANSVNTYCSLNASKPSNCAYPVNQ